MRKPLSTMIASAIAVTTIPATQALAQNWNAQYTQTATGHHVGDADAPVQLVAYISYSCPGCKNFELAADAPMRAGFIHSGKVGMEVRLAIRNPVDMAAALMAECGPEEKFFDNHRAILFAQDTWQPTFFGGATQAQINRWTTGLHATQMRAIASDGGFYPIMERRGYSRAQVDRCLADEARANELRAIAAATREQFGFAFTPSFAINGQGLEGVHGWAALEAALNDALAASDAS